METPGDYSADTPQRLLAACRAKPQIYTAREVEFLRSIAGLSFVHSHLTPKQADWLTELAAREPIDFADVNSRALSNLHAICRRWLPNGKLHGNKEYVALNPTRADGKAGSFRINIQTGKWADFAADARGGDPISLAAYLHCGGDQIEGALALKRMLGA